MPPRPDALAAQRLARYGALTAIAGILLSGPLATAVIQRVRPQPDWYDARLFVASYHPVQALPYLCGLFFVSGCLMLVVGMHGFAPLERRAACLLGVVTSSLGATFVFFNYLVQTTVVPALVGANRPEQEALMAALTMVNPASLAWPLEMWGYAFLGLGSWIAAPAFDHGWLERAVRWLLAANGIVGIAGAAVTVAQLDWVLSTAGLVSYTAWNVLFLVTLALAAIALRRRLRAQEVFPSGS
jgi:hypothetical protein